MTESKFQQQLKEKLEVIFPGCIILKNDPTYLQGMPDLLILYKSKWAALECKANAKSHIQPNQKYYVDLLNRMSFARFIFPQNEEEVLYELQRAFKS